MFTPERVPREDKNWQEWRGDDPPRHVPVFVHARDVRIGAPEPKTT